MKIRFVTVGKTEESHIKEGISIYEKRIGYYLPFEMIEIPALKNTKSLSLEQQKVKEGELLLKYFEKKEQVVLLDEKGRQQGSVEFSDFIQQHQLSGAKALLFVVGGPYGFSKEVYNAAGHLLSLSKMTFPHQLVRLIFVEQLYRAMTIMRNEPYHHV